MATLQIPSVADGESGWSAKLRSDLVALNNDIAANSAAISALSGVGTSSPFGALVNVKDYGAVGNGSTDDTVAIKAARDVVIATKNVNGQCTKALYFPSGKYRVTQPGTILDTPDAAGGAQTQVKSFYVIGDGKRKSQIYYDYSAAAVVGKHTASNALFIIGNRVNQFRVREISFSSVNASNTCFFFWSRTVGSGGAIFPEYGGGNNQDIQFTEVEIGGAWRWGILLDGDVTANLNSEFFCTSMATTPSTTFAESFFQSGYTDFTNNDQQDQFVNYSFIDCKMEVKAGNLFTFNRGGVVHFTGGSYINGIGDNTGALGGGTFFKVNDVPFHNSGAMNAQFHSVRFELRNTLCRLFDVKGWYGESAHISLYDCNDSGHAFTTDGPLTNSAIFRTHNGSIPQVRAINCYFGGYWAVLGGQTGVGRLKFDQCGFYNWKGGSGTVAAANTFVRYDTATVPKVTYIDCPNVTNASN